MVFYSRLQKWLFAYALSSVCMLPLLFCTAAQAAGSLGIDTVSYFSSERLKQESLASTFNARWKGSNQGDWFQSSAQGFVNLSLNKTSYYGFEFPEAYVGTSAKLSSAQVFIGRKLESWSHLDEKWRLGIFQPCFRWDHIQPDEVGLLGAFITVDQPYFQLVAYGSPIFIPERGAQMEFKDGNISAPPNNPFVVTPSSSTTIKAGDKPVQTPIRYRLNMPSMADLVLKPGAGVMTRVGGKKGAWGSASYAYKPMNQVLIGYTAKLDINSAAADANLYPRVAYHHVGALEAGFAGQRIGAWVSVLGERPIRDQTPDAWTTQEVSPSIAVSSTVDVDVFGKGASATKVDVSYLRQWGGVAPDAGPYSSGVNTFDSRYPYSDAISVGLKTPLHGVFGDWARKLVASSRMLYDVRTEGTIVSTEVKFRHKESWTLGLGADILTAGVEGPRDGSAPDFITRFRANDRIHGGVSYAF